MTDAGKMPKGRLFSKLARKGQAQSLPADTQFYSPGEFCGDDDPDNAGEDSKAAEGNGK